MSRADAFVSLGSNLGERRKHLERALAALDVLPETAVAAVSPLYETDPVGPPPQGPYLNAVVQLSTGLEPRALLEALLEIERAAGRVRGTRWAARTLDLDLLLHGERRVAEPDLRVPHPRMTERPFVLEPLADLAPGLVHPERGETIALLARRVRDPRAVRRCAPAEPPWPPGRAALKIHGI